MKKTTLLCLFAAAAAIQGCRVYQPGVPSRNDYANRQQRASASESRSQNAVRRNDSVSPVSVKPVSASSVKPVPASSLKPVPVSSADRAPASSVKPVSASPAVASPAPVPSINAVADYKGASVTSTQRKPVASAPAYRAPVKVPAAADTVNARPEYAGSNSGLTASHTHGASIAAPAPRTPVADNYRIYTIQPGDSAGRIANANGMTLSEFTSLNNISDPNRIRVGQTVKVSVGRAPIASPAPAAPAVPAPVASRPASVPASVPQPAADGFHVVREGDCLSRIASQHGLTSAQLMEYNSLKDANHIIVGQKLRLSPANGAAPVAPAPAPVAQPAPAVAQPQPAAQPQASFPERTEYGKVVSGEAAVPGTNSTIDDILENGLIGAAQESEPAPAVQPPPAAPAPAPAPAAQVADGVSDVIMYTVGVDEDSYNVAQKFNCAPLDLRRLNPNCDIKPGAVIKVPVKH